MASSEGDQSLPKVGSSTTNDIHLGESIAGMDEDEPTVEWKPSKHEKAIIFTLAFLNLIVSLDATIVVTSLTSIVEDIGGTTTQAFWIGTSYLLVNAVSMPIISSISEVVGRPVCLTFAIVVFIIGTILCCTAHSIAVMLVGRSIQGIGGGGIHIISLVTQTDFVPLRWRPKWYGVTLAAWAIGLSLGPIIGGIIAERTTWRWIFYLMFPILGFGLVAVPYLLTLRPKKTTVQEKFSRIDWLGILIFTGSITSFLIAVSWGGTQYPWNSAATLAPLIIGVIGIIATGFYEAYVAKFPFLRKSLFHDRSSVVGYIAGGMQGIILYGTLYYIPFYFESVKAYSPTKTGVALLAFLLASAISGIMTGRLMTRFNNFRLAIWIGWLLGCVGMAVYIVWRVNDSKPVWVITLLIAGISQGTLTTSQNFATQAMCKLGDEGAASAMYTFVRQLGMALGIGTGATTFQNVLKLKLGWDGLPTEIADRAGTYTSALHALPDGPRKDAIYDAYKFGFQIVFATWLGVSVLLLFLTLVFIKHTDMNRKLVSEHRLDSTRIDRHWGRKDVGREARV
ncbi:major facilitator superfamily transporter [Xylaria sp. FL0064]|nr:major facilitator superfamily transporter [Xylaria sp. FL0064]